MQKKKKKSQKYATETDDIQVEELIEKGLGKLSLS